MGMFKNMKDALGQAAEAQEAAAQMQQQAGGMSGMGGVDLSSPGGMQNAMADRSATEAAAHENNRILGVGSPGTATIKSHVDTGEQLAGNAVWMIEVEVAPEGGAPYTVQKREIVPAISMSGYADGVSMPCRIDPADPNKIAFGDKPFM